MQRQLTLDLGTPPPSTFDNFYTGANAELVARLRGLDAALAAGPVADRTFYVWGEPGNGRSHLLHALVHEAPPGHARFLGPPSGLAAFAFDPQVAIYAVDDCDALSGAQQIALFNLFNEVRAHPTSALVATGRAAPLGLAVREDLRTRLGWGLVFHLAPLSDEGKVAVLKLAARERGIALAEGVPAYLLTHFRRDMPSLMGLLDALDRFSLEQKRAVTLPLLRAMLATAPAHPAPLAPPPAAPLAEPSPPSGPAAAPASYTPAHAPAAMPRAPRPAPFTTLTDNVDGELGAGFRDVVDRELGGDLTGEVEADVSGELNGRLDGELDETSAATSGDTPRDDTPTAPIVPTAPAPPHDTHEAHEAHAPGGTATPDRPAPETGSGNGNTRFK